MSIEERLTNLEKSVDLILNKLNEIKQDTNRMDSHISFVEGIYERIKSPFHHIMRLTSFSLIKNKNMLLKNQKRNYIK
jgi:hypothetical protein